MNNNNSWDAWEHYDEEDYVVTKSKTKPKVKKMRKEKEFESKKRSKRK